MNTVCHVFPFNWGAPEIDGHFCKKNTVRAWLGGRGAILGARSKKIGEHWLGVIPNR